MADMVNFGGWVFNLDGVRMIMMEVSGEAKVIYDTKEWSTLLRGPQYAAFQAWAATLSGATPAPDEEVITEEMVDAGCNVLGQAIVALQPVEVLGIMSEIVRAMRAARPGGQR